MNRIKEFDALRALAAFSVVAFHSSASLFSWGWAGVDFFFVISGFLITSIILEQGGKAGFPEEILHPALAEDLADLLHLPSWVGPGEPDPRKLRPARRLALFHNLHPIGSPQEIAYRDWGLMMRLHFGSDVDRSRRAAMGRKSRGKMRTPVS